MKNLTIWKFPITPEGINMIGMPKGAHILTIKRQLDTVCIWALVDPEAEKEIRGFRIYGTGHPITNNENLRYLDTFMIQNDKYVFHVFEVIIDEERCARCQKSFMTEGHGLDRFEFEGNDYCSHCSELMEEGEADG